MTETLIKSRVGAGVVLALTAFMAATFGLQAAAQPIASAHSSTAAANCWITGPGRVEDSPIRVCHGKATLVVLVNKGDDLRETVSVGRDRDDAAKQPAAQTAFGPFKQALPAIEWRIAGGHPFAIIQRWRIADNGRPAASGSPEGKPLLVVSRLPPGAVCPVAYIDAAANPDADEIARNAADEIARDFICGKQQPKIVGAGGRAAELATAR